MLAILLRDHLHLHALQYLLWLLQRLIIRVVDVLNTLSDLINTWVKSFIKIESLLFNVLLLLDVLLLQSQREGLITDWITFRCACIVVFFVILRLVCCLVRLLSNVLSWRIELLDLLSWVIVCYVLGGLIWCHVGRHLLYSVLSLESVALIRAIMIFGFVFEERKFLLRTKLVFKALDLCLEGGNVVVNLWERLFLHPYYLQIAWRCYWRLWRRKLIRSLAARWCLVGIQRSVIIIFQLFEEHSEGRVVLVAHGLLVDDGRVLLTSRSRSDPGVFLLVMLHQVKGLVTRGMANSALVCVSIVALSLAGDKMILTKTSWVLRCPHLICSASVSLALVTGPLSSSCCLSGTEDGKMKKNS